MDLIKLNIFSSELDRKSSLKAQQYVPVNNQMIDAWSMLEFYFEVYYITDVSLNVRIEQE